MTGKSSAYNFYLINLSLNYIKRHKVMGGIKLFGIQTSSHDKNKSLF